MGRERLWRGQRVRATTLRTRSIDEVKQGATSGPARRGKPKELHTHEYVEYLEIIARNWAFPLLYTVLMEHLPKRIKKPEATSEEEKRIWKNVKDLLKPPQFRQMWFSFVVTRNVEAFEHYLTRVLMRVFIHRPEALKSSEQIGVKDVLGFGNMRKFVQYLAENRVATLSYKGFRGLIDYLNSNLGLDFDTSVPEFEISCEYIETRNIIVHNNARVSAIYLNRTKRTDLKVGDMFPLSLKYVVDGSKSLSALAQKLDLQIVSHFRIPAV
jgi:hypothetical protein